MIETHQHRNEFGVFGKAHPKLALHPKRLTQLKHEITINMEKIEKIEKKLVGLRRLK